MKKRIFTIFGLTAVCVGAILIASSIDITGGTSVYARTNGSETYFTGSPGDLVFNGQACDACHSGSAVNSGPGTFAITSTIPGTGYVAGNTYTINYGATGTGTPVKIGCEIIKIYSFCDMFNRTTFVHIT